VSELQNIPHLEVLLVEKLILHEHHDHQRTPPIIQSIEQDGLLRNPPIVVPADDGSGRYIVLDGANRVTALQQMGVPHVIAQIIQIDDPGLGLTAWNHVIWGITPQVLLDWIRNLPEVTLLHGHNRFHTQSVPENGTLGVLKLVDGQAFALQTGDTRLVDRVRVLNRMVDSYATRASLDRTMSHTIGPLRLLYPELTGLLLLPPFRQQEVLYLAVNGILMPKGITRFTISGRALNINIPLGFLYSRQSVDEKRAWLRDWIQDRFFTKSVRYYAEPVYIFDE
jgi:hypothetical protein